MKKSFLLLPVLFLHDIISAQESHITPQLQHHLWEYEVKVGFNLGGITPIPIPNEIREIRNYNPTFLFTIEGNLSKWFKESHQWGIASGIRIETKGMRTHTQVKNYHMEIIGSDDTHLKGNWTGKVHTHVHNIYLTLPLWIKYAFHSHFNLKVGSYFSYLIKGKFKGYVHNGYLRKDNPTGDKINFENGVIANYDFSAHLRNLQWGLQIGIDWQLSHHFKVYSDFIWGMNNIFHQDFQTISFSMYPINISSGVGYVF